jgi:hypothetical protein
MLAEAASDPVMFHRALNPAAPGRWGPSISRDGTVHLFMDGDIT